LTCTGEEEAGIMMVEAEDRPIEMISAEELTSEMEVVGLGARRVLAGLCAGDHSMFL
jgi:hypothetical protein